MSNFDIVWGIALLLSLTPSIPAARSSRTTMTQAAGVGLSMLLFITLVALR